MTAPAPSPLDPEQLRVLGETRALGRKLRTARGIALANVIGLSSFAFLSLASDVMSLSLSPIGVALGLLAYNEERGRRLLVALDARAPGQLALNQLALLGFMVVYCASSAYTIWSGPDPLVALASQSAELGDTLREVSEQTGASFTELGSWARTAALFTYAAVLAASVLVQGLMARYYRSLRGSVDAFARAPAWARALG
jgi:hypothetical protein